MRRRQVQLVSLLHFCGLTICLLTATGCLKQSKISQPLQGLRAKEVQYVDISCPILLSHFHFKPSVGRPHGGALRVTDANAIQQLADRSLYTDPPPAQSTSGLSDFRVTFYRKDAEPDASGIVVSVASGTSPGFFKVLDELTTADSPKYSPSPLSATP